jgi:hypothetical protein
VKGLYALIKKGDINAVVAELKNIGTPISQIKDEKDGQNAAFSVPMIKDEALGVAMMEWLVS